MIGAIDTGALHAILRSERRRAALAQLETASFIDVHTVARLRDDIFTAGAVDREDIEALFAVDRRAVPCCTEWRDFYVDAVIAYVTATVLDDEAAAWLLRQADRTRTVSAFAILLGALEGCRTVPLLFVAAVAARAEGGWPGLAALSAVENAAPAGARAA